MEGDANQQLSRYSTSNFLSKLLFIWVLKDVWAGFRGRMSMEKIDIPMHLKADDISIKLNNRWNEEIFKRNPNLLKVLVKEFGWSAFAASFLNFGKYCFGTLTQIYFLGLLVENFDSSKPVIYSWDRQLPAIAIIVVTLFIICLLPQSYFIAEIAGIKMSKGCSSLIFEKILRISTAEMCRQNIGHLITVISNDVAKFDYMCRTTITRLFDPFVIVAYIVFLYFIIGLPSLPAVAVVFVFLFINIFLGKLFKNVRKHRAGATDQRIRYTAEMISEVRAVKMLCWEDTYYTIINRYRQIEEKYLTKICIFRTISAVQSMISTQITYFTILVAIVLTGNEITPKKVFTSFGGLASLRVVVVILMGRAFEQMAYTYVSLQRLNKLLLIPEMKVGDVQNNSKDEAIAINCESSWIPPISDMFILTIETFIPTSRITIVAGPVASGKSSFLLTLANELFVHSGDVILGRKFSYLPQKAWLFPASIKQNILFGLPYDHNRYIEVLHACAIDKDLYAMPDGDKTEVDDKGLTLSGGQKARIALARSLYSNSDIYLLDDPLSAVDVKVEKHIYKKCFLEMKSNNTIVLATHRLQNLMDDTNFIYLNNGQITYQGLYSEMKQTLVPERINSATTENIDGIPETVFNDISLQNEDKQNIKLQVETTAKNDVSNCENSYRIYFQMALNCCNGFGSIILLVIIGTIAQACSSYFDISTAIWTNEVYQRSTSNASTETTMANRLYFLGCILLSEIVLFSIGYGIFYLLCFRANRRLHQLMLQRVLKAEMAFFDTNHTGEIINKFSKDLENLDDLLPQLLVEASRCGWNCLGLLANVAYSSYFTIGPMVICVLLCIVVAYMYSKCIIVIKHAEALARSPVYTYFNSTIQGLAIIRSHESQSRVTREFNRLQDNHASIWFFMRALIDWIGLVIELISSFVIIAVIVIVMTMPETMTASKIGLGIASMLLFGDLLEHSINQFLEADNRIVSVNRIKMYSELPVEYQDKAIKNYYPSDWCKQGSVVFDNVSLYYGEKSVLKSISFSVKPGEKIGIVGRTGAGKSSIATALFRMAPTTGTIAVDGVDIQTIPLSDYRQKLSVIPQNPVILAGSIRYNLDPSNEHSDEQLWEVLKSVNLKACVEKLGFGLDSQIDHLSAGEKQLCCLTRVILRQNKIIVMDEATSSVDNNIDQEIQKLVQQRFKHSTMFIIAHRLETVLNTDRLMVLHNGEILEFDKPSVLLKNPNTIFKKILSYATHES